MGKTKVLATLKIVLIGAPKVGKYSLSNQYTKGWIPPKEDSLSTSTTESPKVVEIDGGKYSVNVVVCRDIENDSTCLEGSDGIMFIYSVLDQASISFIKTKAFQVAYEKLLSNTNKHSKKVQKENESESTGNKGGGTQQEIAETPMGKPNDVRLSVPLVLVGNKVDEAKLARAVETSDGESLSKELNCEGFFETAAPCNADVPKAFGCLVNEIVNRRKNKENSGKGNQGSHVKGCCIVM